MSGNGARFALIFHDPQRLEAQDAGSCTIGPDGAISEVVAASGFEAYLASVAARLNAVSVLHRYGEPKGEAIPGAMYLRAVRRGDPDFAAALHEELAKYYGIALRPG